MHGGTLLERARLELHLSNQELYADYFALGGTATSAEMKAYLAGDTELSPLEHDVLTHALNESFLEAGNSLPLPYARP